MIICGLDVKIVTLKHVKKGYLKKHKQYQHEGMVFYKCDQCSYRSLKKPNFEFWQTHAGKGT